MRKIVHGSTFSGIGAAEIASEMLGWENAFHCEINPFGRKVLDYYFPQAESYEDITKTDFSKWRGQIDVLTGGFPCQPFSYAGKRRGSEDDRYLWPYMLKCIHEIRPTWFIGENVAGITTMVLPGEDVKVGGGGTLFNETDYMERNERYVIEEICEQLEREGYSVQPMLIPACATGAPHRRDRIFFIAHRDAADTYCRRRGEMDNKMESQITDGEESLRNGRIGDAADTDSRTMEGRGNHTEQCNERDCRQPSKCYFANVFGDKQGCEYLKPGNRWRAFPTQSPVYRGNDGLPFDVDNLAIPFAQWKKESLKAYGNAIVVQVIYEILHAINEIENQ